MVVYFVGGTVGTALGGSVIDLTGGTGIGLVAMAARAVAASIIFPSGRTFMAGRER